MIRTSAHTPPGQSYSDTESDRTDDTVEEILKQRQKSGRDQFDDTDGFQQSKTKGLASPTDTLSDILVLMNVL